jgi:hypothetical protein
VVVTVAVPEAEQVKEHIPHPTPELTTQVPVDEVKVDDCRDGTITSYPDTKAEFADVDWEVTVSEDDPVPVVTLTVLDISPPEHTLGGLSCIPTI